MKLTTAKVKKSPKAKKAEIPPKPGAARRRRMNIGIDARFWGLQHAGLGRYLMELIQALSAIDRKNNYTLFLRKPYDTEVQVPRNFRRVTANIRHYTFEEQWLLAEIFTRENLDILHVPHFNVPLLYRRPFVVTIHDLLWHEVKGLSVTTQNPITYLIKYLGYKLVVSNALSRSQRILVPSKVIRDKLTSDHAVSGKKIVVTHEAPSKIFKPTKKKASILAKYGITEPFVIFVGSPYPHKNIPAAAAAVKKLNESGHNLRLVVASSRSVFSERLVRELQNKNLEKFVWLTGFVPDYDLVFLLAQAQALVQPSRSEGFGLPGLEAMAVGCPVVASDLDVFEEVYKDAALYVDPNSVEDIAEKLKSLLTDTELKTELVKRGRARVKSFSWRKLAGKTLKVYKDLEKKS